MYIYGLYSSDDENIRYVGKTKCKLIKRLKEHINGAILRNCNTHKDNWIRKVYKSGNTVKIKLLERCTHKNWEDKEKEWIRKLSGLTNLTDGGDGGHGEKYKVSYDEMKEYIHNLPFKINSLGEFEKYKSILNPKFPKNPDQYFKRKNEWISWGDFLNTGRVQDNKKAEKYLTYYEAKRFLKKKKIRYLNEYHDYIVNEKIDFLPYRADRFYLNRGWVSWMDYLGTIKTYEINSELLSRYVSRYFKDIKSGNMLKKRFSEINNSIRYKYFVGFDWKKHNKIVEKKS